MIKAPVKCKLNSREMKVLGGALVLCTVMASITYVFPVEQRTLAMSINASVLALGQVTGMVLGSFLIGRFGSRPVNFIQSTRIVGKDT